MNEHGQTHRYFFVRSTFFKDVGHGCMMGGKIGKNEWLTFIKKIKNMVYVQTEFALESRTTMSFLNYLKLPNTNTS